MKIVKKNVYYCDHCKKRSLSKHHLFIHECHCTNNPHRACRMCDIKPEEINKLITDFKGRYVLKPFNEVIDDIDYGETLKAEWTGNPVNLDEVRNAVDGCPACMLAIIRQCKFAYHYFEDEAGFKNFNYKGEMEEAMREKRNNYREEEYYY